MSIRRKKTPQTFSADSLSGDNEDENILGGETTIGTIYSAFLSFITDLFLFPYNCVLLLFRMQWHGSWSDVYERLKHGVSMNYEGSLGRWQNPTTMKKCAGGKRGCPNGAKCSHKKHAVFQRSLRKMAIQEESFSSEVYDRKEKPDEFSTYKEDRWGRGSVENLRDIESEMDEYKLEEMPVHPSSRRNTKFSDPAMRRQSELKYLNSLTELDLPAD